MHQNFTGYLVNTLSNRYQSSVDYSLGQLFEKATIIRTTKKLPQFLHQSYRDDYDLLINSHIHIEFFDDEVNCAIDEFSKTCLEKGNEELITDLFLVDATKSQIMTYSEEKALEAYEANIDLTLKTIKKRFFKRQRFLQESIALHSKAIGLSMPRCTGWQMQHRKEKLKEQDDWAKKTVITNGINTFTLAEAGQTRKKKLNELYVIAKGIEKLGETDGMSWASVVCTVPANMHPNPTFGQNSWDGILPNESANWLQNQWSKVRADLGNDRITLSGIWTREAHRDATPHINFLIYFHTENKHQVEETFNTYFAHSEKAIKWRDGGEVEVGQKKASFASYALKYFSKFLSTDGIQSDESVCEEAWASAFGLRRYGFFGVPSLQQWRGLRAKRTAPTSTSPLLQSLWRAARRNDAAEWIALSGGLGMKNKNRPIKTVSHPSVTGKSCIAVGVEEVATGAMIISKRIGEWTIKTLKTAITDLKQVATIENQLVTLALSYPSKTLKPSKILAEYQKRAFLLHAPPLIQ